MGKRERTNRRNRLRRGETLLSCSNKKWEEIMMKAGVFALLKAEH